MKQKKSEKRKQLEKDSRLIDFFSAKVKKAIKKK